MALFQSFPLSNLSLGVEMRCVPLRKMLEKSNLGLGTFQYLDGEMILLDGICYQVSFDGKVKALKSDSDLNVGVPYSLSCNFEADVVFEGIKEEFPTYEELCRWLKCNLERNGNDLSSSFFAFKIRGHFAKIKTRSIRPIEGERLGDQSNQTLSLDDFLKSNSYFFDGEEVRTFKGKFVGKRAIEGGLATSTTATSSREGTCVGFYVPTSEDPENNPRGFHFHYLGTYGDTYRDDIEIGGHLVELCKREGSHLQVEVMKIVRTEKVQ